MTKINVDTAEIHKFSENAAHWWDPAGPVKALHEINPIRLDYIEKHANLAQKKVLDLGCGGGILSEGMAKRGAIVTGIDLSQAALRVAELHLHETGLNIDYQVISAEEMAKKAPETYDLITCLEMLEHVPDPESIVKACGQLCKPGGQVFFSTLHRNPKSYLQAIIAAEYLLKLIPRGTHDYAKFIRPSELSNWARQAGLELRDMTGLSYQVLSKQYHLTQDVSVNYLMHFQKRVSS